MIENADYFVRLVDFPVCSCGGAVTVNDDGTYTVLINSRLSADQNRRSYAHEVGHLERGDLHSARSADQIERDAV